MAVGARHDTARTAPNHDLSTRPHAHDKAAFEDLPDGVLVADEAGDVVTLNAAGARLLGRGIDEVLGRDYREVLPLTDVTGRDWWVCTVPYAGLRTRTGQPERRLALPDGRELYVACRYVRPSRGGAVTRLVVAFRGAEGRERAERDRSDLVSMVAHELRSPLTSVKGFTATLLAKWDRFTDDQRKLMLETIDTDADRVTRLIGELLDVSRIDTGRVQVNRQVVDVAATVRHMVAGRAAAGERAERFRIVAEGELPEMWLDPDKFAEIVDNLLENAVRHGAGTVTVSVIPSTGPDGERGAEIVVADEGEGIPDDLAGLVFRRFWRSGRKGGTGLGLYIVRGMARAHGGDVRVERASGGAEFHVWLPAATPAFMPPPPSGR